MSDPPSQDRSAPAGVDDKATGLPLLRSWPAVYTFVLAAFVLLVIALTILTRYFTRAGS